MRMSDINRCKFLYKLKSQHSWANTVFTKGVVMHNNNLHINPEQVIIPQNFNLGQGAKHYTKLRKPYLLWTQHFILRNAVHIPLLSWLASKIKTTLTANFIDSTKRLSYLPAESRKSCLTLKKYLITDGSCWQDKAHTIVGLKSFTLCKICHLFNFPDELPSKKSIPMENEFLS